MIAEIDLVVSRRHVLHVFGAHAEGLVQQLAAPNEQAAGLERLGEPLVRIERDRVGPFDAAQAAPGLSRSAPSANRKRHRRAAKGRARAADVGKLRKRIDAAGVGRAGIGNNHPRQSARAFILGDRWRATASISKRKSRVARQRTDLLWGQADDFRRPVDRPVPLLGRIENEPRPIGVWDFFAGHDERRQVRLGAAAGEQAGRFTRIAEDVLNQSSTTISTWAGPAASFQTPANRFALVARQSPRIEAKVGAPGMNARKRG